MSLMLRGIPVYLDSSLFKKRWEFPKNRFVTYEPKDESWCRFFGIGKEVTDYLCYHMRLPILSSGGMNTEEKIIMHPNVWAEIVKKEAQEKDKLQRENPHLVVPGSFLNRDGMAAV